MRTLYFIILKFFQMAFNDFTLLLCPINTGGHWEIAFAFQTNQKNYLHQPSWRTTQQHCKIHKRMEILRL